MIHSIDMMRRNKYAHMSRIVGRVAALAVTSTTHFLPIPSELSPPRVVYNEFEMHFVTNQTL